MTGAYEYYRDKPISYSRGNFVLDAKNPAKGWEIGYLVRLDFNLETKERIAFEIIPYRQAVSNGGVKLLDDDEKVSVLNAVEEMKTKLEDSDL